MNKENKNTKVENVITTNEEPIAFYSVDENGTLKYLAHKASEWNEIIITLPEMHVGIQKDGNIKTGKEWLLNTLPGEHPIEAKGRPLTNYKGSCQGCCDGCEKYCYAIKGARTHRNAVLPSTIKNLVIYRMDPKRFEAEIDAELSSWKTTYDENGNKNDKVFRWHASGEIEDYAYLEMMARLATKHPDVHFYSYTKRFAYVEKYLKNHGDFPTNFVMNLSVWGTNLEDSGFDMSLINKVQRFEWKDEISAYDYNHTIHCRSVIHNKDNEKKGHLDHDMTCKKCGLCWRGKCKSRVIVVYNH